MPNELGTALVTSEANFNIWLAQPIRKVTSQVKKTYLICVQTFLNSHLSCLYCIQKNLF